MFRALISIVIGFALIAGAIAHAQASAGKMADWRAAAERAQSYGDCIPYVTEIAPIPAARICLAAAGQGKLPHRCPVDIAAPVSARIDMPGQPRMRGWAAITTRPLAWTEAPPSPPPCRA
ncbi:hypothetical protein [Cucumibacter marinus]|uniref:hypothetical protein n=1 Tax=Cucumibacter marinus TaxID=1121252 RepID=UPI00040CE8FB|nr:hypothetical protein [Cucumibacter marinus]